MSTSSKQPVATLYTFPGSMWASAPRLGLIEKGYGAEECVEKNVDLLKGENFAPEYLRINPKGAVPALVVPYAHTVGEAVTTKYKALTESTEILDFLDSSRKSHHIGSTDTPAPSLGPATIDIKSKSDSLISLVHSETAPDGNLLLLSARNDRELSEKAKGVPLKFLSGRQEALERYAGEGEGLSNAIKAFYADRIKENGTLLAIYQGKAEGGVKEAFFEKSQQAWANLPKTLQKLADSIAAHRGTYLLGEQVSLADLHAGAWLARILSCAGVTSLSDAEAIPKLEKAVGGQATLPAPIGKYWATLAARESFQKVYGDGLH